LPQGEGGVASQDVRRAFVAWPALPCGGRRLDRSAAKGIQERKPSLLETVVRKLPTVPDLATNVESYLAALDRVLEDRLITADEESRLVSIAQEYGLTASEIVKTHHCYLLELLRVALRDGILTKLEREDLEYVRRVLGISDVDAIALLGKARQTPIDPTISGAARPIDKRPITGKTICFTGELRHGVDGNPVTREQAEAVAKSIGMVVRKSVTKKLDYLVVADAATSSAKARKARGYGCRIIAEPVFWQMVASRPS
jgi:NAD-dependent DNA ligase